MTTERLYFADPYLTEFHARVVVQTEHAGRPVVALDRSAFYPEGGGQPADHGTLSGVAVLDVQVADGVVWHTLAAPLASDSVQGVVDWARRFDHMQQHHGQHLLSAAFEQCCGLVTLSFHLGATFSTIDIDTPSLTSEQATTAAKLVNQIISEARPVHARFVTLDELVTLPLRKPPTVEGAVRVVSVPEFDYSACGGTHPRSTAGVGLLHIRRWERRGNQTRVEFLCGGRALHDYHQRDAAVQRLAAALSVGPEELEVSVERLRAAEERVRKQLDRATSQLLAYEAQELLAHGVTVGTVRVVRHAFSDRSLDELRTLARAIAAAGGVALLGTRGERAQLLFARGEDVALDCGTLLRTAVTPHGGRGGGQAALAQGGIPDPAHLDAALDTALKAVGATE